MIFLWLIVAALLYFHFSTRYGHKGRLYNKLPGPKPLPLIGSLWEFRNCDQRGIWQVARSLVRNYSPISRVWGFHEAIVNIHHPHDLEILLSSQKALEKGYIYWYLEPWLQTGLLTSTDDKWRNRRKILTPTFHFGILKKYMEITSEQGEKMIESLKEEGSETVKSITSFFSNYTLNIICEATMGVALDKLDAAEVARYKQAVRDMGKVIIYRLLRPYYINRIFPHVPKMGLMQKRALEVLHGFTDKVIQERKNYHKNEGDKFLNEYINLDNSNYDDVNIGTKRRLAMLDLLLAAEKTGAIDKAGIQEEVDTFVFEGHDTTSSALTFITLLLAENKEAQDRARAEVTAVMDASGGKVGNQEMHKFPYLERCIKESLRLYPPVPTLLRYIREDLQLKHALLPNFTHIVIHLWDTHRIPEFWPDPEKFDPDRFLSETTRHPFCYVPFSAGPRNCIGQKFAMMELKALMARILYDFYLEPVEKLVDLPIVADLVLRTRDPAHVKFVKINK